MSGNNPTETGSGRPGKLRVSSAVRSALAPSPRAAEAPLPGGGRAGTTAFPPIRPRRSPLNGGIFLDVHDEQKANSTSENKVIELVGKNRVEPSSAEGTNPLFEMTREGYVRRIISLLQQMGVTQESIDRTTDRDDRAEVVARRRQAQTYRNPQLPRAQRSERKAVPVGAEVLDAQLERLYKLAKPFVIVASNRAGPGGATTVSNPMSDKDHEHRLLFTSGNGFRQADDVKNAKIIFEGLQASQDAHGNLLRNVAAEHKVEEEAQASSGRSLRIWLAGGVSLLIGAVVYASVDAAFKCQGLIKTGDCDVPVNVTITPSPTPTASPTVTVTPTSTASPSPSATPSASASPSLMASLFNSITSTVTSTATTSATPSATASATPSPSALASIIASVTASISSSVSVTATPTATPSIPPSTTPSVSATPTLTFTATASSSATPSGTPTPFVSFTPSPSPSATPSGTSSSTVSATTTPSVTATPTASSGPGVLACEMRLSDVPVPLTVGVEAVYAEFGFTLSDGTCIDLDSGQEVNFASDNIENIEVALDTFAPFPGMGGPCIGAGSPPLNPEAGTNGYYRADQFNATSTAEIDARSLTIPNDPFCVGRTASNRVIVTVTTKDGDVVSLQGSVNTRTQSARRVLRQEQKGLDHSTADSSSIFADAAAGAAVGAGVAVVNHMAAKAAAQVDPEKRPVLRRVADAVAAGAGSVALGIANEVMNQGATPDAVFIGASKGAIAAGVGAVSSKVIAYATGSRRWLSTAASLGLGLFQGASLTRLFAQTGAAAVTEYMLANGAKPGVHAMTFEAGSAPMKGQLPSEPSV